MRTVIRESRLGVVDDGPPGRIIKGKAVVGFELVDFWSSGLDN